MIMKNFSLLSLCFLIILSVGCKQENKTTTNENAPIEQENSNSTTFNFSVKSISKSTLTTCKRNPCPQMDIRYLYITNDSNIGEKINKANEENLSSIVQTPNDSISYKKIDEGVNKFIEDYISFKNEFPESPAVYELKIDQEQLFENNQTLVYSTTFYTYTGGAHGYGAKLYHTYDKNTGRLITNEELLKNKNAFKAYAEGMFRKKFNLSENESLNKNGFFFENDEFKLAENIAVTKDSLYMIYNAYEAASYAEGDIKFSFPKEDVEAWLNQ